MTSMPIPATYMMIRIQPSIFLSFLLLALHVSEKPGRKKEKDPAAASPSCRQPQPRGLTEEEVGRLLVEMWTSDRVSVTPSLPCFLGLILKAASDGILLSCSHWRMKFTLL